jgi:hypothetical protein
MRNMLSTNEFKKRQKNNMNEWFILYLVFIILITAGVHIYERLEWKVQRAFASNYPYTSPLPITPTPIIMYQMVMNQDTWIGEYADQYATPKRNASYLRYQLHCLAHKENNHHANNNKGDSGLASGMYQFHQATWLGFRKIMMQKGLITEIGNRDNDRQAIETTAWALANGRENNWGPIANRNECE